MGTRYIVKPTTAGTFHVCDTWTCDWVVFRTTTRESAERKAAELNAKVC